MRWLNRFKARSPRELPVPLWPDGTSIEPGQLVWIHGGQQVGRTGALFQTKQAMRNYSVNEPALQIYLEVNEPRTLPNPPLPTFLVVELRHLEGEVLGPLDPATQETVLGLYPRLLKQYPEPGNACGYYVYCEQRLGEFPEGPKQWTVMTFFGEDGQNTRMFVQHPESACFEESTDADSSLHA
ncbi:MAG: hypothetical protein ACFB20_03050 [Opitutales bacterium]